MTHHAHEHPAPAGDWQATLRAKGYRLTPQRELVLRAVDRLGHATPDEILGAVREESQAVNISTVYRTLELLEELGLVRHAHITDRAPTYHSAAAPSTSTSCAASARASPRWRRSGGAAGRVPCGTLRLRHRRRAPDGLRHLRALRHREPGRIAVRPMGSAVCRREVTTCPTVPAPCSTCPERWPATASTPPVAAHYGSFTGEQRTLEAGDGFVDLSHRDVVRISGPDRLTWLHSLTTQDLDGLAPRVPTATLVLSPQGHVEHALYGVDDGESFTAHVEPGEAAALVAWLDRMRFMMRVEVADVTDELAVTWRPVAPGIEGAPYSGYELVPRDRARGVRRGGRSRRAALWAFEALRIARGRAPARARHRPPHDPQRGRLDRHRRAPGQGLLPRPGDGRPRAHAGPSAASADPAAPRRLRQPAARARQPTCSWARRSSGSSAPAPGTTSWGRSRWRW